jgi:hypothetical protein
MLPVLRTAHVGSKTKGPAINAGTACFAPRNTKLAPIRYCFVVRCVRLLTIFLVLFPGCVGGKASNPLGTEQAKIPPTNSAAASASKPLPPMVVGAYSLGPIIVTSRDSWSYEVSMSGGGSFSMRAEKDVVNSPPGKARLRVEVTFPTGWNFVAVGADAGRQSPKANLSPYLLFPTIVPVGIGSDLPFCSKSGSGFDDGWNTDRQYLDSPESTSVVTGLECHVPDLSTNPGSVRGISGDLPESDVDRAVADWKNATQPIIVLGVGAEPGCIIEFAPSNKTYQGSKLSAGRCGVHF